MQTHFAKGKGNDQSCNVENEVFKLCSFCLLHLHVVKRQKVMGAIFIFEEIFGMNQLFGVYEFEGISPKIVNCRMLYSTIEFLIMNFNNPQIFQIK